MVKLHTWAGEKELPEPAAGRPCIQNFTNPEYDTVKAPKNHKLLWVEFPDFETELEALQKTGHAGIGIGLNATGIYNSYYCSQTQEMTLERIKQNFFPSYNCYIIIAGIVSEKQVEYEENVFRDIIKEVGGVFLSDNYKPDVLTALDPWNLDCIRNVSGFRMNRHAYCGSIILSGPVKSVGQTTRKVWSNALDMFGETYITDRGGVDDTPFIYSSNHNGRFWLTEADVYPDMTQPDLLEKSQALVLSGITNTIALGHGPGANGLGVSIEPITSFFPEVGPNAYLLFRKIRRVFDPEGLCAPGRQVFTQTEYENFPDEILEQINQLRQAHGLGRVEKK